MGAEGSGHIVFVVLAAQGEQDAFAPARRHEFLKFPAGRIEHHAFRAILAADAGPQGVVTIEGDGLELGSGDRVNPARHGGSEGHEIERCVRHASQLVAVGIEDFRHRIEGGDLAGGEQVNGGQAGDAAPDLVIQLDRAGTQNDQ